MKREISIIQPAVIEHKSEILNLFLKLAEENTFNGYLEDYITDDIMSLCGHVMLNPKGHVIAYAAIMNMEQSDFISFMDEDQLTKNLKDDSHISIINRLIIAPHLLDEDTSRVFLNEICINIKQKGYKSIRTGVSLSNQQMQHFLENCGFIRYRKFYSDKEKLEYIAFEKKL